MSFSSNSRSTSASLQEELRALVSRFAEDLSIADQIESLGSHIDDPALVRQNDILLSLETIAEAAAYKATHHPDWTILAGRLEAERIHRIVPSTLLEMIHLNPSMWNKEFFNFYRQNHEELEEILQSERDFAFTFFGIRTLEKSYLVKYLDVDGEARFIETPQRMYLRVATMLFMPNLEKIKDYYDDMSRGLFTHASPTLFHSGLAKGAYASCYLLSYGDSMDEITRIWRQTAMISKSAGGVGLDVSNIRHSRIGNTGVSNGIVPLLKVQEMIMNYVDQGGRRKGSATIFLQPWHIDFPDFLLLRRNEGSAERRARDLFYAVWNCDLFMERVNADETWSLFCPKKAPMLHETYGDEFRAWYLKYEDKKVYSRQVSARQLWFEMIQSQIETGMPFMANKDTANATNNQSNLGLIRSSNLCMEIVEVTDSNRISSCNLASIAVDEFVTTKDDKTFYDFEALGRTVKKVVRGLNRVIDRTWYPLMEVDRDGREIQGPIKETNLNYRPLGLGVQALADTFAKMDIVWDSKEAKNLNRDIFATIYYHAIETSAELAKRYDVYQGFYGSPASRGLLKFDLMARERARRILVKRGIESPSLQQMQPLIDEILEEKLSPLYDWDKLRKMARHGLRNSMLVALMPTASSAQIRNKNESFEAFTRNLYKRTVLSGSHIIINGHMVRDFEAIGLWRPDIVNKIIAAEGSVQNLTVEDYQTDDPAIIARADFLKKKYRTTFEMSQKMMVNLAIDRQYYVCQSQSLNIFIESPTYEQMSALHFFAWENALTTGMYYLRTSPTTEAIKFTVEGEVDVKKPVTENDMVCTDEVCIMCQS